MGCKFGSIPPDYLDGCDGAGLDGARNHGPHPSFNLTNTLFWAALALGLLSLSLIRIVVASRGDERWSRLSEQIFPRR
jgi:hypothetical protein